MLCNNMRVAVCMYATYMNCYAMLFGTGLRAHVPRQENGTRESGRDEPIVTLAELGSRIDPDVGHFPAFNCHRHEAS